MAVRLYQMCVLASALLARRREKGERRRTTKWMFSATRTASPRVFQGRVMVVGLFLICVLVFALLSKSLMRRPSLFL